jgi:hypothetical protein
MTPFFIDIKLPYSYEVHKNFIRGSHFINVKRDTGYMLVMEELWGKEWEIRIEYREYGTFPSTVFICKNLAFPIEILRLCEF